MQLTGFDTGRGGGPRDHSAHDRLRKAAMVVQFALAEGRKLPLEQLPERAQIALTREIAQLRLVDRPTLEQVAEEFSRELDTVALTAPTSMSEALRALDGQISPAAAARLREEDARLTGADPWPRVLALTPEALKPVMETESTEVCAVLLSKLPVTKAAELLGLLPGDRARRITYAVSRTRAIGPAAVHRIGRALADEYGTPAPLAFDGGAAPRLGAILNSSQAATREDVLEGLTEADPAFAEEVRKAIFTFPDIPHRLRPADVAKVLRLVDAVDLTTALAAALATGGKDGAAADFVLESISQRMAGQLREDAADRGKVKPSEAEAAFSRVVTAIRDAAESGEIALVDPEEEADG